MKIKLGVIFGGKSVEHEIAIITANQAINSINTEKYEIIPIYISKQGKMFTGDCLLDLAEFKNMEALEKKCIEISLCNNGKNIDLIKTKTKAFSSNVVNTIDIAFPIMHGTNGEDGAIQGFLEILGVPYVGPDVLASSIGMDKIMMRRILKEQNIPCLDYVAFYVLDYIKNDEKYIKEIEEKLRYPVIVKAGNLGSSVGIKKAKDKISLVEAIEYAMQFSDRIMVENAVVNLKEINCSVLGDAIETEASTCEQPLGSDEILSYTDKYVSGGNKSKMSSGSKGMASLQRKVPADITEEMSNNIKEIAIKTFKILGCNGVSRIDFLVDNDTNEVFVNEINTIPGALSYYLWEATDLKFTDELDKMISLALKRDRERKNRVYSYDQNILALQGGTKGAKQENNKLGKKG